MFFKNTFKSRLVGSASFAAVLMTALSSTAIAQDGPADDEIIVTGSRIPLDPNLTSPVPVQSLTADDFRLSGEISLADVVNDVPALVSSLTAENSVTGILMSEAVFQIRAMLKISQFAESLVKTSIRTVVM